MTSKGTEFRFLKEPDEKFGLEFVFPDDPDDRLGVEFKFGVPFGFDGVGNELGVDFFTNHDGQRLAVYNPAGYWEGEPTADPAASFYLGVKVVLDPTKNYVATVDWTPNPTGNPTSPFFYSHNTDFDLNNSNWNSYGQLPKSGEDRQVSSLQLAGDWPFTDGESGLHLEIGGGAHIYSVTITEVP